ncbi:MAG TPA: alpha/beta hydrolase [Mucilaginibacter sp.]|jgi:pimeloyl-ACP methyl ester carboxylesterase|nr:alpha/beta hydrolase [Mucilaginibacter sp.]
MIKKQYFTIPGAKGRSMLMDLTFDDAIKDAPMVIFAHGFKGFKDWGAHNLMAWHFAENGYKFLKFNFSHNGTTIDRPAEIADLVSFSDNTFSVELQDLETVIDFVCGGSAMPPVSTVYLMGHSMGGGICIIKTAEDLRIKKLVTMASISAFRNLWPKEIEVQWRLQGIAYFLNKRTGQQLPLKVAALLDLDKYPARLDIIANAAAIKQPWLIIHGDADPTVPVVHAEELKAANPASELSVVPGADHTFGASQPYTGSTLPPLLLEFCTQAIAFFDKLV